MLRWLRSLWRRPEPSQLIWRQIAALPDDAGQFYPDGHPQAGQCRRARVSRYTTPDLDKLRIVKRSPSKKIDLVVAASMAVHRVMELNL